MTYLKAFRSGRPIGSPGRLLALLASALIVVALGGEPTFAQQHGGHGGGQMSGSGHAGPTAGRAGGWGGPRAGGAVAGIPGRGRNFGSAGIARPTGTWHGSWGGTPGGWRNGGWHGDIHSFQGHDLDRWHGGHWYHGWRSGRIGWWWIVGGGWYLYDAPVWPYPEPYYPDDVAPATADNWYYCPDPPGYYPYVPSCPVPWQPVPAQ